MPVFSNGSRDTNLPQPRQNAEAYRPYSENTAPVENQYVPASAYDPGQDPTAPDRTDDDIPF